MIADDVVRVTTTVDCDANTAFALFTDEVDAWWKRGKQYRPHGGTMRFLPGVGGRFVEELPTGEAVALGEIRAWEPGVRLAFDWRGLREGERTVVEIRFEAIAAGTRVTVEHRGWGRSQRAFLDTIGLYWGDLLVSLRRRAS